MPEEFRPARRLPSSGSRRMKTGEVVEKLVFREERYGAFTDREGRVGFSRVGKRALKEQGRPAFAPDGGVAAF